jgi:hypothetical protein
MATAYLLIAAHGKNNYIMGWCSMEREKLECIQKIYRLSEIEIQEIYLNFEIVAGDEFCDVVEVDDTSNEFINHGHYYQTRDAATEFRKKMYLVDKKKTFAIKTIEVI